MDSTIKILNFENLYNYAFSIKILNIEQHQTNYEKLHKVGNYNSNYYISHKYNVLISAFRNMINE